MSWILFKGRMKKKRGEGRVSMMISICKSGMLSGETTLKIMANYRQRIPWSTNSKRN